MLARSFPIVLEAGFHCGKKTTVCLLALTDHTEVTGFSQTLVPLQNQYIARWIELAGLVLVGFLLVRMFVIVLMIPIRLGKSQSGRKPEKTKNEAIMTHNNQTSHGFSLLHLQKFAIGLVCEGLVPVNSRGEDFL
jgi:flagellar biosynthesis/type III secretory pathway M-ring protein FliF/YscJ